MKKILRPAGVFIKAMPHFLVFELIFKLLLLAVGTPVTALLLKLTMKLSGVTYLNDENLLTYLRHPSTLIVIALMLFSYAFFSFVELSALVACFSCYNKKQRIYTGGMFRTGLKAFAKAFRGTGIVSFLAYMAIMPLAQFSLSSGMFMAPLMPVMRRIFNSMNGALAVVCYVLVQLLFIILIISASYSIHYLILTDKPFKECIKSSKEKMHGQRRKMIISALLWSIGIVAFIGLLTFGLSFIIVFIVKGFSKPGAAFGTALKILRYTWSVFTAVSAFFSAPAIIWLLTDKFMKDVKDEDIVLPNAGYKKFSKKKSAVIIVCLAAVSSVMNLSYLKALSRGNVSLNVGIISRTQVTAHRGFSKVAPENTLPAFKSAMDCGADYIELDIQLTADDRLVVIHDDKLDRTTNGTGMVEKYTYDQLRTLSAGSWFGKDGEFDDVEIPLFSDVLELVGDDIMLNIEIKRSGDPKKTAEKAVELIEEYGIVNSCYITSFSYPALKKVKQLNPKIKTGFIANLATATSFAQLPYIDAVSMNYLFVNQAVVNSAHHHGKRIFVWTVNRQSEMQKMMALGVDNIITDRPDKALEIVNSKKVGDTVLTALKFIFGS
ncbi:MAG: glycerophosphoryl diester phosphodiesterase membrane domain-containing protein [Ruminococcus sp.]|uniref:glycerophosphodiester phosphodiesterase family protein n=1 Tax=Ruminococcus sp. TaxID=41978 RepID=UPI0025FEE801|nr:glycerophosphodiester phosphodiesterase family protein [Ruminococcus sp.]MBR5682542.1 glycerophosphoryl diester phosphodiesterase membrane domain-containing protein [Ruminococcus sp.]